MKNRRIAPVFTIKKLNQPDQDTAYWQSQSYEARLAALEELRQEYNRWKNDVQPGLQRVYRIVKR
jgi:hypothetical protein